jgi:hypothetical protein
MWQYICKYRMFWEQAHWTLSHTSHKDTEQSTTGASITLDGVTLTDSLIRWSPNEWPSVCREIPQCLPIICSGRLISLHNYFTFKDYLNNIFDRKDVILMTSCVEICAKYTIETVSKDGTHVPKYVILISKLHLQETVLCWQEYNKYFK